MKIYINVYKVKTVCHIRIIAPLPYVLSNIRLMSFKGYSHVCHNHVNFRNIYNNETL